MSCFHCLRIAQTLSFLLLLMLMPPQFCFGSPQADVVSGEDASVSDDNARINTLIRDLRNPKFGVREAASQRLIEVGSPAIAALRLATESDSLEVRVRAHAILGSILQGQDSSFGSSSDQVAIKQFQNAESPERVAILRAQANARNTALFLHLLDIVTAEEAKATGNVAQADSPIEAMIADESVSPLISSSLITRNWSNIEKILTHPGILKYSPMLRVNEARRADRLEAYIEDRYQNFSQAHAAQKTVSSRELISLIGLLRVQQDFERAETVIGWLSDVDMQRNIRYELVFQQGDWQEILRRGKLDPAAPDFIPVNLLQAALLHHLLGDEAGVEDVKQQLRKQLQTAIAAAEAAEEEIAPADEEPAPAEGEPAPAEEEIKPADGEPAPADGEPVPVVEVEAAAIKLVKTKLRIVGAITLDWPLMAEFLDPANQVDNFDLMVAQNRAPEALGLLELGPGFKDRHAWMEATLKEISEAREKMNKRSGGRRNEDYGRLKKLVDDKSQLVNSVAAIVEQWGMDDEAQLYFQMIYTANRSQRTGQAEALEQLMRLGRTDDYWQLVASIFSDPNQQRVLGRNLFGINDSTEMDSTVKSLANLWASRIRGVIADPLEQAKTIAAIVNSPWVNREELVFDLDFEIARFRSRSKLNATGADEFALAQVFELNGRDEAATQMLEQAARLGYSGAIMRSYQKALAANDDRGIVKYWIGAYSSEAPETCLVAEQAALKLLETETDPDQIKTIKQQLKICQLAIAAKWIGGGWSGFFELHNIDKSHLAIFRLQCMVYGVAGDFLSKRLNHNHLGHALVSKEANQASQGGIEAAAVIFDELAFEAGAKPDILWSSSSSMLNLALAQGMIARGEYDQAADSLVRYLEFMPGDVSAGETAVKKLDQAGATEAADRVYQAVEKYFVKELELYPESPISRNNYAWLSATSNRNLEMARRHAQVAVKVRPNVEQYLDTLAEIEFLLGRPEEAFKLSKRCVQLSPERNYYRQQKERFRQAMLDTE